jgi:hypothetical protein
MITNGNRFIIASIPLTFTTSYTIAKTHRGVSLITASINFNIQSFIHFVTFQTTSICDLFFVARIAIHRIIHIVTICIALNSTNAFIMLLGINHSINDPKLNHSTCAELNPCSKPNFNHSHGLNIFIKSKENQIATVVVSI